MNCGGIANAGLVRGQMIAAFRGVDCGWLAHFEMLRSFQLIAKVDLLKMYLYVLLMRSPLLKQPSGRWCDKFRGPRTFHTHDL